MYRHPIARRCKMNFELGNLTWTQCGTAIFFSFAKCQKKCLRMSKNEDISKNSQNINKHSLKCRNFFQMENICETFPEIFK